MGNATEAWMQSHPDSKAKRGAMNVAACKLMKKPVIIARINELQKEHAKNHQITTDSILWELEAARQLAIRGQAAGAVITATMAKAKICGFITDKHELTGPGGVPLVPPEVNINFVKAKK